MGNPTGSETGVKTQEPPTIQSHNFDLPGGAATHDCGFQSHEIAARDPTVSVFTLKINTLAIF